MHRGGFRRGGRVFLDLCDFFRDVSCFYPFITAMIAGTGKRSIQRQTNVTVGKGENTGLIRRACSDPDAFAQLYLLHYGDVYHYCLRRLFDRHCAEEVTSTVFFKVMENLSSFSGQAAGFRMWLLRIATNAVNDHLRNAKRRKDAICKAAMNAQAASVFAIASDDELLARKVLLRQTLLGLKPKHQTVIALRFFEKMKLTEIADCLGEKPSTVRTRLSRATARLRKDLNAAMNNRGLVL